MINILSEECPVRRCIEPVVSEPAEMFAISHVVRQSRERCQKSSVYREWSTSRQSSGIEYRTDNEV